MQTFLVSFSHFDTILYHYDSYESCILMHNLAIWPKHKFSPVCFYWLSTTIQQTYMPRNTHIPSSSTSSIVSFCTSLHVTSRIFFPEAAKDMRKKKTVIPKHDKVRGQHAHALPPKLLHHTTLWKGRRTATGETAWHECLGLRTFPNSMLLVLGHLRIV